MAARPCCKARLRNGAVPAGADGSPARRTVRVEMNANGASAGGIAAQCAASARRLQTTIQQQFYPKADLSYVAAAARFAQAGFMRCARADFTPPFMPRPLPPFFMPIFINDGEYGHCIETRGVGRPWRAVLSP